MSNYNGDVVRIIYMELYRIIKTDFIYIELYRIHYKEYCKSCRITYYDLYSTIYTQVPSLMMCLRASIIVYLTIEFILEDQKE